MRRRCICRYFRSFVLPVLWLLIFIANSGIIYLIENFHLPAMTHVNCSLDRNWTFFETLYFMERIWTLTGINRTPCTWPAKIWCIGFALAGTPFNYCCLDRLGSSVYRKLDQIHSGFRKRKRGSADHLPVVVVIFGIVLFVFIYAIFTYYTFDGSKSNFWPYDEHEWDYLTALYVTFMQFSWSVGECNGSHWVILGHIIFVQSGLCMAFVCVAAARVVTSRHLEKVEDGLLEWYRDRLASDPVARFGVPSAKNNGMEERLVRDLWRESATSYLAEYSMNEDKKRYLVCQYRRYCAMVNASTQSKTLHAWCQTCQMGRKAALVNNGVHQHKTSDAEIRQEAGEYGNGSQIPIMIMDNTKVKSDVLRQTTVWKAKRQLVTKSDAAPKFRKRDNEGLR